jgi:hypothetical protein
LHEQFHKYTAAVDNYYIESQTEDNQVVYRPARVRSESSGRRSSDRERLVRVLTCIDNADTLAGIVVQLGMMYEGRNDEYDTYRTRLNDNFQTSVLSEVLETISSAVGKVTNFVGSLFT